MLESISLDRFASDQWIPLIRRFPVFDQLNQSDSGRFKAVLSKCRLFQYLPGEAIIEREAYHPWIVYLLKGVCQVLDERDPRLVLDSIRAGQIFGELDVVLDTTGQKTIIADPKDEGAVVLALDSAVFTVQSPVRDLQDSVRILMFQSLYRSLVFRQRWLKDVEKKLGIHSEDPDYQVRDFEGRPNSKAHLIFFDIESKRLAGYIAHNLLRIHAAVRAGVTDLTGISTFMVNEHFEKARIKQLLKEVPFVERPVSKPGHLSSQKEQTADPGDQTDRSSYRFNELNFLVVEDDDGHRSMAVKLLNKLGVESIQIEQNGKAAWDYLCSNPYSVDIVLCDWVMPELSGLDLFNAIREAEEHFPGLIFIMLTSIESKTSVVEAVESGVHGYVIKPLTEKHIRNQIQQALKHVRGASLRD